MAEKSLTGELNDGNWRLAHYNLELSRNNDIEWFLLFDMMVHGFIVVTLARLLEVIISKIKRSTLMRKIAKTGNRMMNKGLKTFVLENLYHFAATTIMIILSVIHPGHAIQELARGGY